ncbi:hypothetical protein DH2020_004511 [Rehmannia glutinosa]|uniref:DNA mismatch repair proteins mutS family domain-containing protein n=1 Tax=Rehmannia glutinosa TaxID=99300 RepID=A0ABR0XPL9_REHGL
MRMLSGGRRLDSSLFCVRMQMCRKPSSVLLVKRLTFSNLLGVDDTLKNGSLKEGTLNWEMLQFKSKFRVKFCYADIPRAGCPVVNLRQTLDDLTRNGFSVCIVEEVQGPAQARTPKKSFYIWVILYIDLLFRHAHPGSPYVFGLVGDDHDLDFPDPMPIVGISRSAKGYCMVSVLETMKTYSAEDNLTEEALVTKLRTCRLHHLFLHTSLRHNSSGTCRWGEFGEGGLLWGECSARQFEWFDGNPVNELLYKVAVKELYGLEDDITFRNVTVAPENRPSPLHLGTATQIGALPTEGIPCLLRVLLPSNCTGLPVMYVRDLLLNPPAYEIASTIQVHFCLFSEACKLMSNTTCSIPEFTCVPPAKLVKLLESRETNHIEFCKIKSVLDDILQLHKISELDEILKLLMDPTWVATGLKVELETLVSECKSVSRRIGEIISFDGENDQKITSYTIIPNEFFEDMESSWKGRVKRIHLEEEFAEVDEAAEALSILIQSFEISTLNRPVMDFGKLKIPQILVRIKCRKGAANGAGYHVEVRGSVDDGFGDSTWAALATLGATIEARLSAANTSSWRAKWLERIESESDQTRGKTTKHKNYKELLTTIFGDMCRLSTAEIGQVSSTTGTNDDEKAIRLVGAWGRVAAADGWRRADLRDEGSGGSDLRRNVYWRVDLGFSRFRVSRKGVDWRLGADGWWDKNITPSSSSYIEEDFLPIISRIRAMTSPLGGPKGEILYAREHEAVWFKGKRFAPSVWAGTPGEEQIKQLRPAFDSKGKKVGEEWFTTMKVEDALASEGRRRKWVFPLTQCHSSEDKGTLHGAEGMKITGLSPYWFDAAQGGAVKNNVDMKSLFLLTGPNGGGKSSLLRSICAAALLGICGFMVPAESAIIPHFDSIMLHMKSYDSPADGKSSFQVEMSEIRSIITRATSKSLVLIDEICRGTETAKGTCIAGSIIETLDAVSCLGIVSTHLHGIFDLPLRTKNAVFKAMGAELIDNQTMPTWKLIDGICRESLAFETAQREGVPVELIQRAEELYTSVYAKDSLRTDKSKSKQFNAPTVQKSYIVTDRQSHPEKEVVQSGSIEILCKEVETAVVSICQKRLTDIYKNNDILAPSAMRCVLIGAKEQPPPSTIGA